jgi:protein-S-isoprenylcysteine O-methyltransferase Ste14
VGEDRVTRQGRPVKVEASRERPNSVLSVITDLIFVSIATYLLLGYALTLLSEPVSMLVVVREALLTVYLLMALGFLAVRKSARAFTARKVDYLYTILGFSSPLFFQPSPYSGPLIVGASLEASGLALVASAFLSLNRSFGLAPQNRGIKTDGVYKFVRHPMYLGYVLAEAGYLVNNFSAFNLIVLAVSVLFLLLRLRAEEQLLGHDQAYRNYSRKTPWKLLPLLY